MFRSLARAPLAVSLALLTTGALAADPALTDEASKSSYALGYQLGRDMTGADIRNDALLKGLQDGRTGAKPALSTEEMGTLLASLQQKINEQRQKTAQAELQKTASAGAAFLATNAKNPGVKTTASGLQYKIVSQGTGKKPSASDTVTVNYRGTLVDGKEFDSSYKRGEPATFPVAGVIPGWTEALQLMKVGTKAQLAIPPELAYGSNGPLANQVLLFDVELLGAMATPVESTDK
jgi:FKBP-type peptidyl-prolyl cis-trans isomerase FklB